MIVEKRETTANWASSSTTVTDTDKYAIQNWRHDLVALLGSSGGRVHQARFDPNGVPYGQPRTDCNRDGRVNATDQGIILSMSYDVRGDVDLDFDLDGTDLAFYTSDNGTVLGRGAYSLAPDHAQGGGHRFAFTGREIHFEDNNLYDMRNRSLRADLGIWTRRDPLGYVDGPNLYRYVMDPVKATDAFGECSTCGGGYAAPYGGIAYTPTVPATGWLTRNWSGYVVSGEATSESCVAGSDMTTSQGLLDCLSCCNSAPSVPLCYTHCVLAFRGDKGGVGLQFNNDDCLSKYLHCYENHSLTLDVYRYAMSKCTNNGNCTAWTINCHETTDGCDGNLGLCSYSTCTIEWCDSACGTLVQELVHAGDVCQIEDELSCKQTLCIEARGWWATCMLEDPADVTQCVRDGLQHYLDNEECTGVDPGIIDEVIDYCMPAGWPIPDFPPPGYENIP